MGTFNYGSSHDIITLGHYTGFYYYPDDEEIADEMEELNVSKDKAIESLIESNSYMVQDDLDSIDSHINNDLDLHFYQVKTVSGYYSGFWIDIENDWLCIDSYKDRAVIQKEITQIKNFLIKCVMEYDMRVHYPGWCVGWEDGIENSIKKINETIKEERQKVKKLPIFDKNDPLKYLRQ
jgi:hypothetical protein